MSCHATKLPDDTQSSSLGLQFLDVLTAHTNTIIPASFGKKKQQHYFGGDLEKSHRKTLQLITTENNPLFLSYHTANALHSHSACMHHPVIPQTFCSVSTKHTKATLTPFSPARPIAFAQHFQVQVSEPISPVTK